MTKIDWKIGGFVDGFLNGKVIQSKTIPIINPRDNQKICEMSFEMYSSGSAGSILFYIDSATPVSETIFFEATVAIFDATMTEKLHEAKSAFTKHENGSIIQPGFLNLMPFSTLNSSKEKYLAENGVLNVRCEVTSNCSKRTSIKNSNLNFFTD